MLPIKATKLLTGKLNDKFYFVVNCSFPNSLRLLTSFQYEVLEKINGKNTTEEIGSYFKLPHDTVIKYCTMLSEGGIIESSSSKNSFILPSKKISLWLHSTNKCNLACSYCYISTLNTDRDMSDDVKSQLLYKILETVKKRQLKSVKLKIAGGEPLLKFSSWKKFIEEAANAFKSIDCELSIGFLTNLTILNQDIIDYAKRFRLSFGISLDGVKDYHDATRIHHNGKGSFDLVDKNIRLLLDNKIQISTSTVVSNANMEGLPMLTDYLTNLNIPFRYSIVKGEEINRNELKLHLRESFNIMNDALDKGWGYKHKFCDLKPMELGNKTCSSGSSGGALYIDGSMYFCQVNFGNKSVALGNIFEEEEDLLELIQKGSDYEGIKSKDCFHCKYEKVCTSGCPVYRVDGKDPNCEIYHEFLPIIYSLQAKDRMVNLLNAN